MKYIMPNVPDITITNKEEREIFINYVYETNMVTLNGNVSLILINTNISDTNMDNLNFNDTYNLNLSFDTRNLNDKKRQSREINIYDMKLIRKTKSYTTEIKYGENVYAFYNGEDDVEDILNSLLSKQETDENNINNDLYFAKVEPNAIIPSKREEDAGYDIYSCETETIVIEPNSTKMIDTGIAIACSSNYFPKFFDKGGMGSKGIIVGAGVGDSGYRDKYFLPLINTNKDKYVVITTQDLKDIKNYNYFDLDKKEFIYLNEAIKHNTTEKIIKKSDCIIKPLNKAITQFVMLPVPKMNIKEITYEGLKNIKSERGLGKLGSSGK